MAAEKTEAPPWYRWHWEAFLKSCRGWTYDQRALYRELLDIQWQEGSIPSDEAACIELVGCTRQQWDAAAPRVLKKFPMNGVGRANPRMAMDRRQVIGQRGQFSEFGKRGAEARWGSQENQTDNMGGPSEGHSHPIGLDGREKSSESRVKSKELREKTKTVRRLKAPPTEPDWLPEFKIRYPKRAGDYNWRGAIRAAHARLGEGHTIAEFLEGAERYARFIRHTGKERTEYVQQASRFLGPSKPFMELWELPPNKAETRVAASIDASQSWLAKQREKANGPH